MAERLTRDAHLLTLVLSEISPFFKVLLSHPLCLGCLFVVLFPYLLKVISFLCPLFFTACLVYYVTVVSAIAKLNTAESRWNKELFLGIDDLSICEMFLFGTAADAIENMEEPPPEAKAEMKNAEINASLHEKEEVAKEQVENSPKLASRCYQEEASPSADDGSFCFSSSSSCSSTSKKPVAASSDTPEQSDRNSSKEWKRTLACKLLEERHSGEGMDSLWEEAECIFPATSKSDQPANEDHDEDEEEEEELMGGSRGAEVCCMQALKLSAGKMSLGMGRKKLGKITKAIKGLGLLRALHVSKKKVHNNGDKSSS